MARRACAAGAFAGELAITSCEFGAVEARVFDSSLATRKMRRAAAEREEDGNESADAGQKKRPLVVSKSYLFWKTTHTRRTTTTTKTHTHTRA